MLDVRYSQITVFDKLPSYRKRNAFWSWFLCTKSWKLPRFSFPFQSGIECYKLIIQFQDLSYKFKDGGEISSCGRLVFHVLKEGIYSCKHYWQNDITSFFTLTQQATAERRDSTFHQESLMSEMLFQSFSFFRFPDNKFVSSEWLNL